MRLHRHPIPVCARHYSGISLALALMTPLALLPGAATSATNSDPAAFDANQAIALAGKAQRPRSLGSGSEVSALRTALRTGERQQAFSRLRERVQRFATTAPDMAVIRAQEDRHRDLATGRAYPEYARRVSDDLVIKNIADTEARNLQEAVLEHQQDRLPHVRWFRGLRAGVEDEEVPCHRDVGLCLRCHSAQGSN